MRRRQIFFLERERENPSSKQKKKCLCVHKLKTWVHTDKTRRLLPREWWWWNWGVHWNYIATGENYFRLMYAKGKYEPLHLSSSRSGDRWSGLFWTDTKIKRRGKKYKKVKMCQKGLEYAGERLIMLTRTLVSLQIILLTHWQSLRLSHKYLSTLSVYFIQIKYTFFYYAGTKRMDAGMSGAPLDFLENTQWWKESRFIFPFLFQVAQINSILL